MLTIPLAQKCHLHIVSVYTPMMQTTEEFKAKFYANVTEVINRFSRRDKVIVLGDFNARVGLDFQTWPGVLGHHSIRKSNSSGHLLLPFCAELGLTVTNTLFQLSNMLPIPNTGISLII